MGLFSRNTYGASPQDLSDDKDREIARLRTNNQELYAQVQELLEEKQQYRMDTTAAAAARSKAEQAAAKIIEDATREAAKIIEDATREATRITTEAKTRAQILTETLDASFIRQILETINKGTKMPQEPPEMPQEPPNKSPDFDDESR